MQLGFGYPFSAHPRESGDPGFVSAPLPGMERTDLNRLASESWVPAFAGMSGDIGERSRP